ncbi:chemokine-like protein TAFA-5a isoform X2 [Entelurus aequoreus]|uniref:chemokine-like protein TAFA-5a isoform X2 n=1 Tax=Entelurus aequoreus TaxID=161455 RepID=UPI002B1D20E8|nr:chemokine-like protein TAFA-5a isoform X2 [Entelurus aequoreus]
MDCAKAVPHHKAQPSETASYKARLVAWTKALALWSKLDDKVDQLLGLCPRLLLSRRQDACRWPRMSSTFWAFVLLTALMVLYCGQLAAGTCEIVTLDRDSSQPRRTIARQTARCACKKGQIAGTTRARPACVDAGIVRKKQWCEMVPCLEDEGCDLLVNKSGWTCTQPGGRVKTTTAL